MALLLETLLLQPPAAAAAAAALAEGVAPVPEEGGHDGDEDEAEVLPSAWDPSDWWGEDEEAAARHSNSSSSPQPPSTPALEHEALSSRRPPTHPQPPPLPRPWNPEGSGAFHASLSADRLTARYVGKGPNHPQDVGTVKADRPLPRRRDCYYFEVEILAPPQPAASTSSSSSSPPGAASTPARANICIGLASRGFPLHRHPGTSPYNGGGTGPTPVPTEAGDETTGICASYAYRGSDGRVQAHVSHYPLHPNRKGGGGSSGPATPSIALSVRGKEYGPGFAPGDVVGCGLDFTTQEASIFFTKNGQHLGPAFQDVFRRASPSSPSTDAASGGAAQPPPHQQQQQQQQRGRARAYSTSAAWVSSSGAATSGSGGGGGDRVFMLRPHAHHHRAPTTAPPPPPAGSAAAAASSALQAALSIRAALRTTLLAAGAAAAAAAVAEGEQQEGGRSSSRGRGGGREERSASFSSGSGGGGGASSSGSSSSHHHRRTDPSALYDTGARARDPWFLPSSLPAAHRQQGAGPSSSSQPSHRAPASSTTAMAAAPCPHLPSSQLDLYPVISLHGQGEAVRANFGQRPFRFDVPAWRRQRRQAQQSQGQAVAGAGAGAGKAGATAAVHALVQDYLAVRGYARTLARFDAAVGGEMETMEEGEEGDGRGQLPALVRKRRRGAGGEEGMAARESMRRLVLTEGEEEAALARLGTEHPGVVGKEAAALGFELRCLAFVSRVRRAELDEALAYAQRELGPYVLSVGEQNEEDAMDVCPAADGGGSGREEREALGLAARLREVLGLLAYPDVAAAPAPLARLASPTHRAHVADMVNAALLSEAAAASFSAAATGQNGKAAAAAEKANGHSAAAAAAEEGEGVGDVARPLLERVLVQLAVAREALKEAKADGRGSPFRLPALTNAGGGRGSN